MTAGRRPALHPRIHRGHQGRWYLADQAAVRRRPLVVGALSAADRFVTLQCDPSTGAPGRRDRSSGATTTGRLRFSKPGIPGAGAAHSAKTAGWMPDRDPRRTARRSPTCCIRSVCGIACRSAGASCRRPPPLLGRVLERAALSRRDRRRVHDRAIRRRSGEMVRCQARRLDPAPHQAQPLDWRPAGDRLVSSARSITAQISRAWCRL